MSVIENNHLGSRGEVVPGAFYVRRGGNRFCSTLHAQGAWKAGEQHLAPASGLVLAEVERQLPSDKVISRVSFDVLGVIYSGEFTIDIDVLRPGRTIELIEATMRHGERVSIRARVWRLKASETTAVEGVEWELLPAPESLPVMPLDSRWAGGYIAAIDVRQTPDARPGRGISWVRSPLPLVLGEEDPPVAGFVKFADTANGLVVREDPRQVFYPNVDLTIHFFRTPVAGWTGFDTRVSFGPGGLGETFSMVSDIHGPVGTVAQSLTVRLGEGADA